MAAILSQSPSFIRMILLRIVLLVFFSQFSYSLQYNTNSLNSSMWQRMQQQFNEIIPPWLSYFLAGALLPSIAYILLRPKTNHTGSSSACAKWSAHDRPYKMVFCVNTDLNMGKGKIAAQCAHAAVGCYQRACQYCPRAVAAWQAHGCAKIALKCPENELDLIAALAMSKDMPLYLVGDAGLTQIADGSRTVLGLFGPVHVFVGVTDHLKLM